jgi:hypothetical protein
MKSLKNNKQNNMRNIESKIGDMIRQSDDVQFIGIYKEFLSFKRRHFVEYHLLKRIPFIENLMQIIEEEMDSRERIEDIVNEKVEETTEEEENEESWKKEWKKQNETTTSSSSMKDDFKRILLYVACFHICLFGFFAVKGLFNEEKIQNKHMENLQETMYPNPINKGPLSNAIGKRN